MCRPANFTTTVTVFLKACKETIDLGAVVPPHYDQVIEHPRCSIRFALTNECCATSVELALGGSVALTPAREEFTPLHDLAVAPVAGPKLAQACSFRGWVATISEPTQHWKRLGARSAAQR